MNNGTAKTKFTDVEEFRRVQEITLYMLTAMHRGLHEITKLDACDGEAMRSIAQNTLDEVDAYSMGGVKER